MNDFTLRSLTLAVGVAAIAVAGAADIEAQDDSDLDITVYRSWRPPDVTVVQGLFWVRPGDLATEGGSGCPYTVDLLVRDANTTLAEEEWTGECPTSFDGEEFEASVLETFQFGLRPATYTVAVTAAAAGAEREAALQVEGYGEMPPASDLVLARDVDWVDSANADQWTFQRGEIGVLTAPDVVVDPEDPRLAYYLELYVEEGRTVTGELLASIVTVDGTSLHTVTLAEFADADESRPLTGSMSLAGLPPGLYRVEAELSLEDTVVSRTHAFRMADPRPVAQQADGQLPSGSFFAELSEEELSRLFDPLVLWLDSERTREQYRNLSPDARRRFLHQFFEGAQPSGDEDRDEPLDIYLSRVRYANDSYVESTGRRDVAAWETDRGEIYILRGAPDARIERPLPGSGSPYEIWSYDIGRGYVYLFADQSGLGNYSLILATDPEYNTMPAWHNQVGGEAIQDLDRFGVRLDAF